jgi:adenylylsulfate reductase subunit B
MPPTFSREKCCRCGTCVDVCPGDVLAMINEEPQVVYPEECIHCGACMLDCPESAINYRIPLPLMLATHPGLIVSEEVPNAPASSSHDDGR